MKHRPHISALLCGFALATLLLGGCSHRGVRMPRHRKRRHCDCPSFGMNLPSAANQQQSHAILFPGTGVEQM